MLCQSKKGVHCVEKIVCTVGNLRGPTGRSGDAKARAEQSRNDEGSQLGASHDPAVADATLGEDAITRSVARAATSAWARRMGRSTPIGAASWAPTLVRSVGSRPCP